MVGLAAEERAWLAEALRKEEGLARPAAGAEARHAGVLNADACDEENEALASDPEADPAPLDDRTMETHREKARRDDEAGERGHRHRD